MKTISQSIGSIEESATLALNAKAKELIKQGRDIVLFGVGEPDFDTPEHIRVAAKKAIDKGETRYTAATGTNELKQAICNKLKIENHLDYTVKNIVVSNGGKHSLSNTIRALCNPGDEVIVPSPYWVSYIEQIKIAGATPVIVKCDEKKEFELNTDDLKDKISDNTKAIILNYPSNPTGAVFSKQMLSRVADLAIESDFYIISDEVYEHFNYAGSHTSIASLDKEAKGRTITVNAVSKTYAMTGWRIGYMAAEENIIKAVSNLQSQETSNPCSISQAAAVAALTGPQDCVKRMVAAFKERRDLMVNRLNSINGIECTMPKGAFYAFPNISGLGMDSRTLSEKLLTAAQIAVVPGIEFGSDNHIRLSYATSIDNVAKGMDRFEKFCKSIK